MTKVNKFKKAADEAAKRVDHTKTKEGGSGFQVPEAGVTVGRLVDYIELGVQKRPAYKGKEKTPVPQVLVSFELLGPKRIREIEVDGQKKQIADRIMLPKMAMLLDSRASFKKLFEKLRYGRDDIKNMAQMIGEPFKITVVHNVVGEGTDNEKTYANITDADGNFLISPAVKEIQDDMGVTIETKKIKVPDEVGELRMFLQDAPNQEMWDSIFIDGEREVKDAKGNTKTVSNNWIQNMIMDAEDFEGSAVQAFLEGSEELPDDPEDLEDEEFEEDEMGEYDEDDVEDEEEFEEEDEEDEVEEPAPKKSKKSASTVSKSTKKKTGSKAKAASGVTKSPSKDSQDALAELGLA